MAGKGLVALFYYQNNLIFHHISLESKSFCQWAEVGKILYRIGRSDLLKERDGGIRDIVTNLAQTLACSGFQGQC